MINNKFAFALSEVLLTLLIIGIVFALCMPMFKTQVQNIGFKNSYKKAFSTVSLAWQKASSENTINPRGGGWCDTAANNANFDAIKSYFKIIKDCGLANAVTAGCWASGGDNFNTAPNATVDSFVDESGVSWAGGESICGAIVMDINGFKGPNQFGRDRFALMIGESTTQAIPDRLRPWDDRTGVDVNECPRGSCLYSSWLGE